MIIQCSACDTRFKLADDKLKPGGVKVRCSKCKEVFTVMPPEEEVAPPGPGDLSFDAPESESQTDDWSDLNADVGHDREAETSADESAGIDWSDMGGDADETETAGGAPDEFSFGDEPAAAGSDDTFSDESATDSDEFSFDDSSGGISEDDFGFDDSVGEGVNDEFSFDDEGSGSLGDSSDAPDFDWDGSAADSGGTDDFDFGDAEAKGGDLDFSSVALEEKEEPAPPPPGARKEPAPLPEEDVEKPLSAKGPRKRTDKRTSRRGRKPKKKSPLRGLFVFILVLLLLAAGHAGILYWKGYWAGDPAELIALDHQTVHLKVYQDLYTELTGGTVPETAEGQIAILGMNGRFVDNSQAGTLFVIEGQIRNDFSDARSAIAVRGILYDQTGKPVMRKKVYCGNRLSKEELQTLPLPKIQERLDNQFGDSLSNLDVAPKGMLPYMVVFGKLPENLAEFNVEVAESAPGSK